MAAGRWDIYCDQGSEYYKEFVWKIDGAAVNLTGYTIRGQIRDENDKLIANLTVAIKSPASSGTFTVKIPYTVFEGLKISRNVGSQEVKPIYKYDVELLDGSAIPHRKLEGSVIVSPEQTHA